MEQQNLMSQQDQVQTPSDPFKIYLTQSQCRYLRWVIPSRYTLQPYATQFIARSNNFMSNVNNSSTEPMSQDNQRRLRQKMNISSNGYGFDEQNQRIVRNLPDQLRRCHKTLMLLKNHVSSGPFLVKVDHIALGIPDYYDVIKEPMDLSTVEGKLLNRIYFNKSEFASDIRRIWTNALLYNKPDSIVYRMAREMSDYFDRLFKERDNNNQPQNEWSRRITSLQDLINQIYDKGDKHQLFNKLQSNSLKIYTYDEIKELNNQISKLLKQNPFYIKNIEQILQQDGQINLFEQTHQKLRILDKFVQSKNAAYIKNKQKRQNKRQLKLQRNKETNRENDESLDNIEIHEKDDASEENNQDQLSQQQSSDHSYITDYSSEYLEEL